MDKKSNWMWPLGLVATGIAAASVFIFRGCWHRKMSWPVRSLGSSYQVCLGCGIKRLFDEKEFRAYGPYSYDLARLIQHNQESRPARVADVPAPQPPPAEQRPAS